MKRWLALACILCTLAATASLAEQVGTAFTYQGVLDRNGAPYSGIANFAFLLYDAESGGNLIGTLSPVALTVEDGLFTTDLDFGAVFDGTAYWLEVQVAVPPEGYTVLSPRQRITAAPYALRALSAPGGGSSQWGNSTYGIDYTAGNVGVGSLAHPGTRLNVIATGPINGARVFNDSPNHAALYMGNFSHAWGIYDDQSGQHYLTGRVGLGTLSPQARLHVSASALGIKAEGASDGLAGTVDAAIWGVGSGSVLLGSCAGIIGQSNYGNGLEGTTSYASGYGGYFANTAGGAALYADGLAKVRTLSILGGADLVEGFDTRDAAACTPGTVVVIDSEHPGQLCRSEVAYDPRVAGVVSGAGGVDAGIRLGHAGVLDGDTPVAMSGRVYVRCTTENGPIRPGDLLTTAGLAGHAMRASDPARSNGAIIGKAMTALDAGEGLVLVLVNLQ